jgi:hypothetical protein
MLSAFLISTLSGLSRTAESRLVFPTQLGCRHQSCLSLWLLWEAHSIRSIIGNAAGEFDVPALSEVLQFPNETINHPIQFGGGGAILTDVVERIGPSHRPPFDVNSCNRRDEFADLKAKFQVRISRYILQCELHSLQRRVEPFRRVAKWF